MRKNKKKIVLKLSILYDFVYVKENLTKYAMIYYKRPLI